MAQSQRQPGFWTHPAHRDEEGSRQEPVLGNHTNHAGRSRSRIPWSPGQTLTSESPQYTPLMMTAQSSSNYEFHQYQPHDSIDEQVDEGRACFFGCRCCGCCRPSQHEDSFAEEEEPRRRRRTRRSGGNVCRKVFYVLLAAATFAGLYYYSSKCSHQHWTMNPGESRQVATAGFLTDSVQVVSHSPSSHHKNNYPDDEKNGTVISRGMAVYAMGNPQCPLLTGPPVTLDAPPQRLVLLHNAFEYQYFYLNKGSTMKVTVHQRQGATNILVLRGSKVLARVQDKKKKPMYIEDGQDVLSDLDLAFSTNQIVLERFSYTQEEAPIEFSFTSPANDVYVLLFDNAASSEPSSFNISYHLVLTTYNLEGLVPWCSHTAPVQPSDVEEETSFTCPPLAVSSAGCIIVQAIEHRDDSHTNNTKNDLFFRVGVATVEVTLDATRRWLWIGILSVVPSVLLALFCFYRGTKRRRRHQREDGYRHRAARHHRHQQRPSEGPNYQYMPPHQEGSDREVHEEIRFHDTTGEELAASHHNRTSTATFSSFQEPTTSCPCAAADTEAENTNDTTLIPAENVVVVKEPDANE